MTADVKEATPHPEDVLAKLLRVAGLPDPTSTRRISERGLDHEVQAVLLADRRQVVLRQWRRPRESEQSRSWIVEAHGLPAPRLLAEMRGASLYEFAPGDLLGDLIETGQCLDRTWHLVGQAYRCVHSVRFPAGLVLATPRPGGPDAHLDWRLRDGASEACTGGPQISAQPPRSRGSVGAVAARGGDSPGPR